MESDFEDHNGSLLSISQHRESVFCLGLESLRPLGPLLWGLVIDFHSLVFSCFLLLNNLYFLVIHSLKCFLKYKWG